MGDLINCNVTMFFSFLENMTLMKLLQSWHVILLGRPAFLSPKKSITFSFSSPLFFSFECCPEPKNAFSVLWNFSCFLWGPPPCRGADFHSGLTQQTRLLFFFSSSLISRHLSRFTAWLPWDFSFKFEQNHSLKLKRRGRGRDLSRAFSKEEI